MNRPSIYSYIVLIQCGFLSVYGRELIELNHNLNSNSRVWPSPGYQEFKLTPLYEGFTKDGYWYSSYKFCTAEHAGTHVDAPSHFFGRGWTVDEIPVERLIAPAIVIDIRVKVKTNYLYELTARDVVDWVEEYGLFPNNSVILIHTGWSSKYDDKVAYFGHPTDPKRFAFPGVSVSAVQAILGYEKTAGLHIIGIGIDTASIDYGPSLKFPVHRELAENNIYILENLKNLDKLPPRGSELLVMPLKIEGGSGSPARVLTVLNESFLSSIGAWSTTYNANLYLLLSIFNLIYNSIS